MVVDSNSTLVLSALQLATVPRTSALLLGGPRADRGTPLIGHVTVASSLFAL